MTAESRPTHDELAPETFTMSAWLRRDGGEWEEITASGSTPLEAMHTWQSAVRDKGYGELLDAVTEATE